MMSNKVVMESFSPEDTFNFGKMLGEKITKGSVVTLSGDLGTGKTLFSKGFAKGLGINEPVVSPTFTIVQEYHEGRMPLYHFDTYRIDDPYEMEEIGFDDYLYGQGVCLIEWPEMVSELLPEKRLEITIKKCLEKGFDFRYIELVSN